jgi:hypothetical protein
LVWLAVGFFILVVITLVLAVPIYTEITVDVHRRLDFKIRMLLFKFISWEYRGPKVRGRKSVAELKQKKETFLLSRVYKAIQVEDLWDKVGMLIKKLATVIKICNVESDLKISLGEDYYTGYFAGLMLPLIILINESFS